MESEISCDDPQFMNMLETCLRVEIEAAKSTSSVASEIKELKTKVQTQLQTRKELKNTAKNTEDNIVILTNILNKHNKYINEISNKIELMKLNLDNDYKVMELDCGRYESIYNEYERVWESYHAKYEEFPLAKVRKENKVKLEKLRVDKMVMQYKINEFEKILKQRERITWLRMRAKIVELARAILDHMGLDKEWEDLNRSIEAREKELNTIKTELAVQLKRQEEEKRDRTLKLLEMPPPKINFSHMRKIYHGSKIGSHSGWEKNYENSIDSLSVDTLMLEEMCLAESNTVQSPSEISIHIGEDQSIPHDRPIDSKSPSLDQGQQEIEHEDVASEVDRISVSEPIDAFEEEVEQGMGQELEHMDQPSDLSKDKHTGQRCEDLEEEMDDPVAKKMRLILDEGKFVATPMKIIPLEKTKSRSVDPSPRARIARIETVRYNMSPMTKIEKTNNDLVEPRKSQLTDQFVESMMTNTPSAKKPDQDKPNPSSMFTPRHYDFSDTSDMSFCMDNNMNTLKADQISLYGGSVRDFCECSNISRVIEDAIPESSANDPSTSKTYNLPRTYDTSDRRLPSFRFPTLILIFLLQNSISVTF
uniref:uncharacterized protein LOC117156735 isoform X2 n=1 Tax=Bombus vancouverensis nearcticus TaxID=2705178 RepID=UPI00143A34C4|nr:uncharacterized protein LOC117156735 isoform X2 [Bombus vancouverensis nearcticus]